MDYEDYVPECDYYDLEADIFSYMATADPWDEWDEFDNWDYADEYDNEY